MKRLKVAGINCYCFLSKLDVFKLLDYFILNSIGTFSVAINAEKIIRCHEDHDFKEIVNQSLFQVPDGVGALLFIKKIKGYKSIKVDLPRIALEYSNLNKISLAIIGANEKNNERAFNAVKNDFPFIKLVGRLNGYSNFENILEFLCISKPQILLFGLGSPKQEIMASKLIKIFPTLLIINCGGAIDVLSGSVKRAPNFIQKFNLEWLYRLVTQPQRFKRQIKLFKILPIYLLKK